MCIAYRPKFDVESTSNFDVVMMELNWRCMYVDIACILSTSYVVYQPKFDVLTMSNFGIVTTEVDRRYIDVACMLPTYVR